MKFDTVVIGGGLSGLICGIKLQKSHKKCVIISSGQSALHFSSGSFDLLNMSSSDESISNPTEAIFQLVETNPQHPYAKIGKDNIETFINEGEQLLREAGINIEGSAQRNHYRVTPLGTLRPTWLTGSEFITSNKNKLEWKNIAILNFSGFIDFYPKFIADEFSKSGTQSDIIEIDFPFLEPLRHNPSELRATNIARVFDNHKALDDLATRIKQLDSKYEMIVLPACIGLNSTLALKSLSEITGRNIKLIATTPPSVAGIHYQQCLRKYFESLGGVYMLGDEVKNGIAYNNRILKIFTQNHGNIPLEGDNFILATGSFFSKGLIASPQNIYEPIFNLDVDFIPERKNWYSNNFYDKQNYHSFGVKTNNNLQGMVSGKVIDNLYVSGAILSGFNPIKEGCGAGVSILSAMYIVDQIIKS